MIYVIINAILCGVLVWYSFHVDSSNTEVKSNNKLVNLILFLAAVCGLQALELLCFMYASPQLAKLMSHAFFIILAWYSVDVWAYLMSAPDFRKNPALTVFKFIFAIAAAVLFIHPETVKVITYSSALGVKVDSYSVFNYPLKEFVDLNWYELYEIIYYGIFPLIGIISVIVRSERTKNRLDRQRLRMNTVAVLVFFISYGIITKVSTMQPMLNSLVTVAFIFEVLIFVKASTMDSISDFKSIARGFLRFLLKYAIPSLIAGIVFTGLWIWLGKKYPALVLFLFAIVVAGIFAIWYQIAKKFKQKNILSDNDYAQRFEDALASIDYSADTKDITDTLFNIFKKNLSTSSLKILIDGGVGDLETAYASDGKKVSIPVSNPIFDQLLNLNHPIVFRDFAEHNYRVRSIRSELLRFMDDNKADAFIMLNEGRHIVGLMFLGPKTNRNVYNDYDYLVFSKLYSYLFVIGYYMKNINNESVVGTVNREIRMSGQIITSIQENMDKIKSPKIDEGHIMVPAHNIGGEFIDLIRLTDTRHMFLIGAMSGKGIAASMSMVILKSVIRTYLAETSDFKKLVCKINNFIRNDLPKGTYFAGLFGLLDFSTDTMYYINCGCPALFSYTRAYNNVIEIQGEGRILGFAKDVEKLIKVKKVKLAAGDVIMACTQGLIETHSLRGEIFGKERVQKSLLENLTYPADKMAKFTYDSLVQFTSKGLEDDVSILVLKYNGGK